MSDAVRGRLADAVEALAEIDALVEHGGDRLPPLLLARAMVELDALAARLSGLRQSLAGAMDSRNIGEARQNSPGAG